MAKKPQIAQIFPHHGKWFLWNPSAKVFAVADDITERERYMGAHFRAMAEAKVHVDFHCWNTHDVKKALILEAGKSWANQKQHWPTFERAVAAAPATALAPARAPLVPNYEALKRMAAEAGLPVPAKQPRAPRTPRATAAAPAQPTASLIPAPPAPAKAPKAPKADKTSIPRREMAEGPPRIDYRAFVTDYFAKHAGKGKTIADAAAAWQKYKNGL